MSLDGLLGNPGFVTGLVFSFLLAFILLVIVAYRKGWRVVALYPVALAVVAGIIGMQ